MGIFESRRVVVETDIPSDRTTSITPQQPKNDTYFDLDLPQLKSVTQGDLGTVANDNIEMLRAMFPETTGIFWGVKGREVRDLAADKGPRGQRFREALWTSGNAQGVANLRGMILNADRALLHPHDLFNRLLSVGQIRIPPAELLPVDSYTSTKDPQTIINVAEKLWKYTGFEGVAGNFSYRDVEDPPGATNAVYHGDSSRSGIDVRSRIAWSDIYESALVGRTPIVLSNMQAAADTVSCKLAAEAGVTPFMFSATKKERLACARELGSDVFITVRTKEDEITLAKEILTLGANVHIELANSYNPKGLARVSELKNFIREQEFTEPRFVSIGKCVGGPSYLASVMAGADLVVTNRGGSPICSTPEVTGRGLRTWSSCYEMALAQRLLFILTGKDVPMMADAGIKSGGDITSAATVGAESGMAGTAFVRTIDSPTQKLRKGDEWHTFNFGDASGYANPDRKQVADQGIGGWFRIPKNEKGEPRAIRDVAATYVKEMQSSIGDGGLTESFFELPIQERTIGSIRVPGEHARTEASSRTGDHPNIDEPDETIPSRLNISSCNSDS